MLIQSKSKKGLRTHIVKMHSRTQYLKGSSCVLVLRGGRGGFGKWRLSCYQSKVSELNEHMKNEHRDAIEEGTILGEEGKEFMWL